MERISRDVHRIWKDVLMHKKHTRHNAIGLLELQCQKCGQYKFEIDFPIKRNDKNTGRGAWCLDCVTEYNKVSWADGKVAMNENLKITLHMRTPIAGGGMIHLDALLATAIFMRRYIRLPRHNGRREDIWKTIRRHMPLHSIGIGDKRIFCGSIGFAEGCISVVRWKKRWDSEYDDLVEFGKRCEKIDHKASYFKQYNMPIIILSTPQIVFYASGDKRKIDGLLHHLSHIGKKSSQGFGEIRDWKIETIEQDWSVWKDGKPMRAIPDIKDGFTIQQTGYIFPYWDARNCSKCIVPTEQAQYL